MKVCFGVLLLLVLTACGSTEARRGLSANDTNFTTEERPLATTLVYYCGDYQFIARLGAGEMALWLEDRYVVLSHMRSASGTLYEEGDISFWSKGSEAMLTVADQIYQNCQLRPERAPWEDARRRGVDFRGAGNEPGWHVEIQRNRQLLFVGGYGSQRILIADPGESIEGTVLSYHGTAGAHEIQVEIVQETCVDTMSGQRFPQRVLVTLDGVGFSGCGEGLEYPWAR